jgi:AcrR family transcriptional regulator
LICSPSRRAWTGLDGLSVNLLVENAGVSKRTFFHHLGDRTSYLVELHRGFHDKLGAEMLSAVDGIAPGPERLTRGSASYLDACLR